MKKYRLVVAGVDDCGVHGRIALDNLTLNDKYGGAAPFGDTVVIYGPFGVDMEAEEVKDPFTDRTAWRLFFHWQEDYVNWNPPNPDVGDKIGLPLLKIGERSGEDSVPSHCRATITEIAE